MDPIGAHHFWGFSPALDLQQIHRTVMGPSQPAAQAEPLNILLLQPGDPRSIMKTIAQRLRHTGRPLHFFLHETQAEVVARDLLLLAVATDWALPLRQRAASWLDVYGNALVQARTASAISTARLGLIDLLCNGKGPQPLGSVVDVESLLKFRQRDDLEFVFKTWEAGADEFDMVLLRNHRLRHNHGERYDFRTNLVDWDYQTAVKKVAGVVHWTQYRDWRETGVAFEFGDIVYSSPNRTLASYVDGRERGRGSVQRRGFWGDMIVSPFHAVGTAAYMPTDAEAKAAVLAGELIAPACSVVSAPVGNHSACLFDITSRRTGSEQWRHHAVEVATYNLLAWLFEMETGRQYVMRLPHDVYSGLADSERATAGPVEVVVATPAPTGGSLTPEEHAAIQSDSREATRARARSIARAYRGVQVTVMTGDAGEVFARNRFSQWGGMHVVALSGRSVHHLGTSGFAASLHPSGAVLVAETARNVPNLKPDARGEFCRRVIGMAGALGAAIVGSDRQLSADSFAVGTVIDLNRKVGDAPSLPASTAVPGMSTGAFGLRCSLDGTFLGGLKAPLQPVGAPDDVAVEGDSRPPLRVKRLGWAAYVGGAGGLPVVEAIRDASGPEAEASQVAVVADAVVLSLRAHVDGIARHDVEGGDNPAPEALVFALLPGRVARAVGAAFAPAPGPAPAAPFLGGEGEKPGPGRV